MRHLTPEELEAGLEGILGSPQAAGTVELIVRRPAVGEREVLEEGELDLEVGLVGDTWNVRGSKRTADGSSHPDMQLNVMNARVVALLAVDPERRQLAGDQLYVDLDLSAENLPPGTRLALGRGVVAPNAHSVAVDSRTHLVYFPLEQGRSGQPELLVLRPR